MAEGPDGMVPGCNLRHSSSTTLRASIRQPRPATWTELTLLRPALAPNNAPPFPSLPPKTQVCCQDGAQGGDEAHPALHPHVLQARASQPQDPAGPLLRRAPRLAVAWQEGEPGAACHCVLPCASGERVTPKLPHLRARVRLPTFISLDRGATWRPRTTPPQPRAITTPPLPPSHLPPPPPGLRCAS